MNNNLALENRPYVPKATVILNQELDFEQIEIEPVDQRPFSQTVVEAPNLSTAKSHKSPSSVNQSKKSYEKISRNGSLNSDRDHRPLNTLPSALGIKSDTTLNSLYCKTETHPQPSKSYLRKGEGNNSKLSKGDKSSNQNEDSSSKRSDSHRATNLYFKALKEVGSNS